MRLLDSHLHLWDPDRLDYAWLEGPLRARFAVGELRASAIRGFEEQAAVFVQADPVESQTLDEVGWVSGIAAATGVRGIVAGARLDRGAATTAHLAALAAFPLVVGVRHLLQGEPDGLATSPAFLDGAALVAERGWTFDACVRASQLTDVAGLAAAVPELPIVLDHLGKPEVGTADAPRSPRAAWLRDLDALAAHPRVSCKLSGLPAEAGGRWDAAQVIPFLDAALDAFGPDRLMWGSDWPVSAVQPAPAGAPGRDDTDEIVAPGAREAWGRTVATWAGDRGLDVDAVLWRNAERFYGLG